MLGDPVFYHESELYARDLGDIGLRININATDEQLISDFKGFLDEVRKIVLLPKRTTARGKTFGRKNFTSADFRKWSSLQILAYLDLTAWARFTNKQLTHHMLGEVLFPNEYDVDLTERVTKTVKPLAEFLTSRSGIEALAAQEYSEQDNTV